MVKWCQAYIRFTGCVIKIYLPIWKIVLLNHGETLDFEISRYMWKCIPITTTCTNSDISALGLDDEPETWRDGGGTRTGLIRDRRRFLEILFFTASITFFTRTDFLPHEIVLSAVVSVALKPFTTLNKFLFYCFITLTSVKPLPLFQHPSRLLVRVMGM